MSEENTLTTTSTSTSSPNPEPFRHNIRDEISKAFDETMGDDAPAEADTAPETRETSAEKPQSETKETAPTAATEESVNWDTLPPLAKKEYLKQKERYDNLRSLQDRKETEWKQSEEKYKGYETKAKQFEEIDNRYRNDPQFKRLVDEAYGVKSNVDPVLVNDPLYAHVQKLEQELVAKINSANEFIQKEKSAKEEQAIEAQITSIERDAFTEFKSHLGRDPNKDELARLWQTIDKEQIYNGKAAVRATFTDEIVNAKTQKILEEQSSKKNKTTKMSNVAPAKASSDGKKLSYKEAAELAWQELGMN